MALNSLSRSAPPCATWRPCNTSQRWRFRNALGQEFLPDKHANKDAISCAIFAEIAAGRGVAADGAMQNAECRMQNVGGGGAGAEAMQNAQCTMHNAPSGGAGAKSPALWGVWFDATGVEPDILRTRYADTVRRYEAAGVDITREPMLVAPAPHTSLGGVVIDARSRVLRPDGAPIPGLFAAGEVTGGVHGLNRIGGNAGTEVLVFGRIAGLEAAIFAIRQTGQSPN